MRGLLAGVLCCCVLAGPGCAAQDVDPAGGGRYDYVIVAADGLVGASSALAEHRSAQGMRVAEVSLGGVLRSFPAADSSEALVRFLTHARADWGAQFVLLVGDAEGPPETCIPMAAHRSAYFSEQFPSEPELVTDWDYATLGGDEAQLHVGRIPAQSAEAVRGISSRTVAYETTLAAGPWQCKVGLLASQAGFGPAIDSFIESMFRSMVVTTVPAQFALEAAWGNPASEYCPFPPAFSGTALGMLQEGALACVYVGHGSRAGFDKVTWQDEDWPILDVRNVQEMGASAGPPVMVALACSTAQIDWPGFQSFGEAILAAPGGPIAFLGATRVSQPYGNGLLGRALVQSLLAEPLSTLGEAVDAAKAQVIAADSSQARQQIDAFAALIQGPDALPLIRDDTLRHFVLLGDPALRLRLPEALEVSVTEPEGGRVTVSAKVPLAAGQALVTLERIPEAMATAAAATQPTDEPGFTKRWRAANDFAVASTTLDFGGGAVSGQLQLPPGETPPLRAKIVAWGDGRCFAGARDLAPAPADQSE